jgi:nitroreductase
MSDSGWQVLDGRPGPVLRQCLVAAAAAPSIHNTQPWRFRLRDGAIDVLVGPQRQLATLDPEGREMVISVGAALYNLHVAVRAHGRDARVRLLPDPDDPTHAGTLTLAQATVAPVEILALARAIPHRHTNRRPFADRPPEPHTMDELARAAAAEHATLVPVDPALRDGVLSLTRTADTRTRGDRHYRAELAAWTTPGGVGRRDGVPRQAFGPRDTHAALPLRDFTLGTGAPAATVTFEPDPSLVLLYTAGDAEADWLRAGAALQRVWLTATVHGLAATPLTQAIEIPRLRDLLADSANGRVVQTILRIGYPTTPAPATPRRPLEEIILTGGDPD